MDVPVNEIVTGRKTFFILPDTSLLSESYLEEFFSLGFECYFIGYDKRMDIKRQIECIISLFKDVIIFFNVDAELPGDRWDTYIEKLIKKSNGIPLFGVLYSKRQTSADKAMIEKRFLFDMGLRCGCIQLEYKKNENFELMTRSLYANQAQGRRKTIRALCTSACTYKFVFGPKNDPYSGALQDISLSHFSVLKKGTEPFPIKLYEKISDIHFSIKGSFFHSDAILVMERPVGDNILYVFSFVTATGASGLEPRTKSILVPVLYNMISSNCLGLLDEEYFNNEDIKTEASLFDDSNDDNQNNKTGFTFEYVEPEKDN